MEKHIHKEEQENVKCCQCKLVSVEENIVEGVTSVCNMRTGSEEAFMLKVPACTVLKRCLTCIQDSFVEDFCKLNVKQRFNKRLLSHIIIQIS
jgi:hypothetical protein